MALRPAIPNRNLIVSPVVLVSSVVCRAVMGLSFLKGSVSLA
jgi:hypothetical protein